MNKRTYTPSPLTADVVEHDNRIPFKRAIEIFQEAYEHTISMGREVHNWSISEKGNFDPDYLWYYSPTHCAAYSPEEHNLQISLHTSMGRETIGHIYGDPEVTLAFDYFSGAIDALLDHPIAKLLEETNFDKNHAWALLLHEKYKKHSHRKASFADRPNHFIIGHNVSHDFLLHPTEEGLYFLNAERRGRKVVYSEPELIEKRSRSALGYYGHY